MFGDKASEFKQTRNKLIVLFILFFGTFILSTIAFMLVKGVDAAEAFSLTMETLSFTHSLEYGPIKLIQIMLLIFGVFFVWFTLWTALDILLDSNLQGYFKEVKKVRSVKKLKDHFIVCGAGRVGMHAADLMRTKHVSFVLIDKRKELISDAEKKGFFVIDGDVVKESVLKEAGVEKAKGLLAVLPETEKNILIILTAKELNPKITIYARSSHPEHIKRLKKAGADYTFLPEFTCAEEIVDKIKAR